MTEPTPHQIFDLGDFKLDSGVTLPHAKLAFATYGKPNAARDNIIVFPTWFTGTHSDLEWLIGEGKPLDTTRYFVVAPSTFANGLSSSPPNTPAPFDRGRFPAITIQDNVRAQYKLVVDHLGAQKIQLAIGGSMGAFQAYQWGLAYPDLVQRIAPCCGAARVSRHCYVFLAGAKAALQADAAYAGGDYKSPPVEGMKAMGRVWAGWALSQRFYRERLYEGMGCKSVDHFLVDFWEAFWLRLDANNLLSQLHTWQTADISLTPGYHGNLEKALGAIRAKAMLSPAETDLYFPVADMAWEAQQMTNAQLRPIPGPFGHLSEAGMDPACNAFLGESIRALLIR